MAFTKLLSFLLLVTLLSLFQTPAFATSKKSYVVYLGGHSHGPQPSSIDYERVTNSHYDLLEPFVGSKAKARSAIFYSYTKHINGFAANLEEDEANELSKHPAVVSVFLNEIAELHTTRSWEFLGLETGGTIPQNSLWSKTLGDDIIIGSLDSGVWPESASFSDVGMGPIPPKWKGSCNTQGGVRCNRKLIGARYFKDGYEAAYGPVPPNQSNARDYEGHGTHTLSTAGGRQVTSADIFGLGQGTAKGGSPNARVAEYKVCWQHGCTDADSLAAFDAAIDDGVDIISVSVGGNSSRYLLSEGISVGSLHAVMKGILVVCSAGNAGNLWLANVAPWIMTVGASTMDRDFTSLAYLDNGSVLRGQSLSQEVLPSSQYYPLILSGDAAIFNRTAANFCEPSSLDGSKVGGKIVACFEGYNSSTAKGAEVKRAGGFGVIVMSGVKKEIQAPAHVLPGVDVDWDSTQAILDYYSTSSSPMAYISKPITEVGVKPAPIVASFSSRGPNAVTPEILKPDIVAPGVNVLAAYTGYVAPSNLPSDQRRLPFNVLSGTSMSCPHVSGIAGLLKKLNPNWSPGAIRSAMMTTALTFDNEGMPIREYPSVLPSNPFGYGAGHVAPNLAADPGLVYEQTTAEYLNYLCNLGYGESDISIIAQQPHRCDPNFNLLDLNYPSITVPNLSNLVTIRRTVKNVGNPSSTYTAQVVAPPGIGVWVQPASLNFQRINEEKTFTVTLQLQVGKAGQYVFGRLTWTDRTHRVSSPIVVSAARTTAKSEGGFEVA